MKGRENCLVVFAHCSCMHTMFVSGVGIDHHYHHAKNDRMIRTHLRSLQNNQDTGGCDNVITVNFLREFFTEFVTTSPTEWSSIQLALAIGLFMLALSFLFIICVLSCHGYIYCCCCYRKSNYDKRERLIDYK